MRPRFVVLAAALIVIGTIGTAVAHGNERHVMGRVTKISGNTISVETTTKQAVAVNISDKTKFEKSGAAASLADLKVGDKVVIHAEDEKGHLTAHLVRFGVLTKAGANAEDHTTHPHTQPQTPRE